MSIGTGWKPTPYYFEKIRKETMQKKEREKMVSHEKFKELSPSDQLKVLEKGINIIRGLEQVNKELDPARKNLLDEYSVLMNHPVHKKIMRGVERKKKWKQRKIKISQFLKKVSGKK